MSPCRFVFSTLLASVLIRPALAQNPPVPAPPLRGAGVQPPLRNHPRQEPCWQVAGVSKSAIEQVRIVRQQARQEIQALCANSSLSVQQRRQQIREIHQKEKQQVEGLISAPQQEAMRACRQQRGTGGHVGGRGHGGGPCGEMPAGKEPKPESDKPESDKED
jgi:hypothetical protein